MIQEFVTVISYRPALYNRNICHLPFYHVWKNFSLILCLKGLILDVDYNADGRQFHIIGPSRIGMFVQYFPKW